jgi:hypothetical protein
MNRTIVSKKLVLIVLALTFAAAGLAIADDRIQLAILLDTSNSMDGLIDQAKAQLWKVVNELARSSRNGKHPVLEVALFEYGNTNLRASDGYLRAVSELTTDLDRISERLFGLSTNGGDEYCGMVIDQAVEKLSWSRANDVLKVIYIAGNEPFTQGSVSYKVSVAKAARAGIIVNTIFCGDRDEGIAGSWKDGADRADGRYLSIDQDEVVENIQTPYDRELMALGEALSKTYVGYGKEGESLKQRQEAQDANAAGVGAEASVQRSVAKAQDAYTNSTWDLLDAIKDKGVSLGSLKDDELPAEMRKMTGAQRETYVRDLAAQRAELQGKINTANEKRRLYVADEMKKRAEQNTLGQAIITSVQDQAKKKGFSM